MVIKSALRLPCTNISMYSYLRRSYIQLKEDTFDNFLESELQTVKGVGEYEVLNGLPVSSSEQYENILLYFVKDFPTYTTTSSPGWARKKTTYEQGVLVKESILDNLKQAQNVMNYKVIIWTIPYTWLCLYYTEWLPEHRVVETEGWLISHTLTRFF